MIKTIKNYFYKRKSFVVAQTSNEKNAEVLAAAAKDYCSYHEKNADHWSYLRALLDSGEINSSFIVKNYSLFSNEYLLTFNNGELRDRFATHIINNTFGYQNPLRGSYLSPEYKFQFLNQSDDIPHASYTTEDNLTIGVYQKNGHTLFTHSLGVSTAIHSDIISIEIYDDHIYLNDAKSKFKLTLSDADKQAITPFLHYMSSVCKENLHRLKIEERLKSEATQPSRSKNRGLNPWVTGALGLAAGTGIGIAISDDE